MTAPREPQTAWMDDPARHPFEANCAEGNEDCWWCGKPREDHSYNDQPPSRAAAQERSGEPQTAPTASPEMTDCTCAGWVKNVPIINGYISLQFARQGTQYSGDRFVFCPWCGSDRRAPSGQPRRAHSMSEYRRVIEQGGTILPPPHAGQPVVSVEEVQEIDRLMGLAVTYDYPALRSALVHLLEEREALRAEVVALRTFARPCDLDAADAHIAAASLEKP